MLSYSLKFRHEAAFSLFQVESFLEKFKKIYLLSRRIGCEKSFSLLYTHIIAVRGEFVLKISRSCVVRGEWGSNFSVFR